MTKKEIFKKLFSLVVYDEPFVSCWLDLTDLPCFSFDTNANFILTRFPKLYSWEIIGDMVGDFIKHGLTDIETFIKPITFFERLRILDTVEWLNHIDIYLLAEFLECYWCDAIDRAFIECPLLLDIENTFEIDPEYKERVNMWNKEYNYLNKKLEKYR